jgi:DNA-binding MarR family transcriptional regulator
MDAISTIHHWLIRYQRQQRMCQEWLKQLVTLLEPLRISVAELLVLETLYNAGDIGRTQVELARDTACSPAQICGLVESLVRRNWLITQRAVGDRRRVICTLSEVGRTSLLEILKQLDGLVEKPVQDTQAMSVTPNHWEDAA